MRFGNPPPDYQWQRLATGQSEWVDLPEGVPYENVNQMSLRVTLAQSMSGDRLRARLSNIAGVVYTREATLTVSPAMAPQDSGLPPRIAVENGTSFSINGSFSGTHTDVLRLV